VGVAHANNSSAEVVLPVVVLVPQVEDDWWGVLQPLLISLGFAFSLHIVRDLKGLEEDRITGILDYTSPLGLQIIRVPHGDETIRRSILISCGNVSALENKDADVFGGKALRWIYGPGRKLIKVLLLFHLWSLYRHAHLNHPRLVVILNHVYGAVRFQRDPPVFRVGFRKLGSQPAPIADWL